MLRPQIPTPRANRQVIEARKSESSARLRMNAISHAMRAGILSCTRATSRVMSRKDSLSGMVGVLIAIGLFRDLREIGRARPRALLRQQRIVARALPLACDRALGVGQVSEANRLSRAGLLAG